MLLKKLFQTENWKFGLLVHNHYLYTMDYKKIIQLKNKYGDNSPEVMRSYSFDDINEFNEYCKIFLGDDDDTTK